MALIEINNLATVQQNIPGINSVSYNYIGEKATAIQPIEKLVGVFTSDQILADSGFVRWLDLFWEGNQNELDIAFFVRSSNEPLTNEKWSGPFYNKDFSLDGNNGKYLQFMTVLVTDGTYVPKIDKITARYISSTNASKFYTKAFDLGFNPETILLTFNADLTNSSIVKFFVSGEDSVDPRDYQEIEPNKIETLSSISEFSDKIKILMELSGEFNTEVAIHELAVLIGGDDATRINKFENQSSESSDSSYSSSSSSSSLDSSSSDSSSSSSSEDYSSSSSSS